MRPRAGPLVQLLDLHNHTDRSYDAVNTLVHYERAYAEGRFHVLGVTDHNRMDGALELAEQASFPVILGMEVDTADGELVGLFLREALPLGLPAGETAARIRDQGGLVYVQHPFYPFVHRPLSRKAREALADAGLIDIVEGLNGGPFARRYDLRAQVWAQELGLPLGAGSDAHDPEGIGRCAAAVPPGPVDATTLPGLLRQGELVDRRRNSLAQLLTKARYEVMADLPARLRGQRQRRLGTGR
jgi:predicted metal-dependent phosphoesterase TrpH